MMPSGSPEFSVSVLVATFNGARFLDEQLASVEAQTMPRIDLYVSDDGSTDGTLSLLEAWRPRWSKGKFVVMGGPNTGNPADNFRSLILRSPENYDFVAYCDQDDIWLPQKLERAATRLSTVASQPAVCCSRTRLITESGLPLGLSSYFPKPPSFRNALVQSLAGGNTMVMNRLAFSLLKGSLERGRCVAHDWWTYQIVTGAGGQMLYSPEADTLYRQHDNNAVGSNAGWLATLERVRMVARGRFRAWNDLNLATLQSCQDLLTPCAQRTLATYLRAREGIAPCRLKHLLASRVYRQTLQGTLTLWAACLLNLI